MNSSLQARSEANEFIRENCGPAAKGLAFDQLLLPLLARTELEIDEK